MVSSVPFLPVRWVCDCGVQLASSGVLSPQAERRKQLVNLVRAERDPGVRDRASGDAGTDPSSISGLREMFHETPAAKYAVSR
jgi:hypothetical protein